MTSAPRMAWRNLWRNGRRTGLALSAIGLSVALVLVYDGILRAYGDWMVATVTGPLLGHAQVHAAGFRKDRAMEKTLPAASGSLAALRSDPLVAGASARVYAPALAAMGEEGFGVLVIGVEPGAEAQPMGLLATAAELPEGRRVLMGRPLADSMGVKPGAVIAIVGQGVDGSLANDLFTVAALIDTPVDLVNRLGVMMELRAAQQLFALGDEAHEIVLRARQPGQSAALAAHVASMPAFRSAEVLEWRALAPEMVALIELVDVAWIIVLAIVFIAASAGVANTMLMATFERTRELGMLLALGSTPWRIVQLVLIEALALGAAGALLGTALGGALVAIFHRVGFDFARVTGGGPSEISFAGLSWSLRLYPSVSVEDVLRAVAAVMITSVVAAAWPAVRAARLQPARALRAG